MKWEYKKREKIKLWGCETNNRKTTKEGFLLTLLQGIYKGRKREKHTREGYGITKKCLTNGGKRCIMREWVKHPWHIFPLSCSRGGKRLRGLRQGVPQRLSERAVFLFGLDKTRKLQYNIVNYKNTEVQKWTKGRRIRCLSAKRRGGN